MRLTMRALIAVVAAAGVVGLVGAYLGAAALQDDSPDEPIVQSTRVASPNEPIVQSTKVPYPGEPPPVPGNDPGADPPPGITRGVEVTPRPCPECFPVPMPSLPPLQWPEAQCPAEKPSPRYSDLALADSGDWLRYDSPHHPLSLSYPPDWILEPSYSDVYYSTEGRIRGPVLETVTVYNRLWFDALGGDPNTVLPPGAAKIELSYNPQILRMGGCEGADVLKVEELPVSVGGKPAQVRLVVGEYAHQVTYSIATGFVAAEDGFVTFGGLTNDPSQLGLIRTVLGSMAFE